MPCSWGGEGPPYQKSNELLHLALAGTAHLHWRACRETVVGLREVLLEELGCWHVLASLNTSGI